MKQVVTAWIEPDWAAPSNVRAASTLRTGGASLGPYSSWNLARHVGDDDQAVSENRRLLCERLRLPCEPAWLNQVHGATVVQADAYDVPPSADASVAHQTGRVCVVMTADCLPVLLCDRQGTAVAAAHAGWRGLANGVLAASVAALNIPPSQLLAWLGPAIEAEAFEVGDEVRSQFMARDVAHTSSFVQNERGRWQADLYALARRELHRLGVTDVYGGGFRVFAEPRRFFSYRRESTTGRMATLVWMDR